LISTADAAITTIDVMIKSICRRVTGWWYNGL